MALGAVIGAVLTLIGSASSVTVEPVRDAASVKDSPRVKDLVLVGTVTGVVQKNHRAAALESWTVTVTVDRIVSGTFSGPTFTFDIHSPGRSGLRVGKSCTIKATWRDNGYVAIEPHPPCP